MRSYHCPPPPPPPPPLLSKLGRELKALGANSARGCARMCCCRGVEGAGWRACFCRAWARGDISACGLGAGAGCGVEGWEPGRWIFAVAGGGMLVRAGLRVVWCCWACLKDPGPVEGFSFGFGAGVAPPYFSRSCWVELYFVAVLSLSIVLVRSSWYSSRRRVAVEMR